MIFSKILYIREGERERKKKRDVSVKADRVVRSKILKISQKLLLLDFNSPILLHSHTRYLSNDIPKLSKPLFYPFFLL